MSRSLSFEGVRGAGRTLGAAIVVAAVAASPSCGGDDAGVGADSVLRGRAWLGGPLVGARVEVYQLVDGARSGLAATTTTGADGGFEVTVDGYEHFELVVGGTGGRFEEVSGGAITLPAGQVLRGVALDVRTGSERDGLAVTPFTDVMLELTRARAAGGEPFNAALALVHDRLTAHLDFDPAETAIGDLGRALAANDDASQHALALAGLSTLAAQAATDLRVTAQDVNSLSFLRALVADAASAEARLDGNVDGAGIGPLHVGASCPADVAGDRATCRVHSNTLRARLAHGVLAYLVSQRNQTGLGRADVLAWVTALSDNADGELFAGDPVDAIDEVGPRLTWVRPVADAAVAGAVAVELTAEDDLGVDAIDVVVVAAGTEDELMPTVLATLTDTEPARARFLANLDTAPLPEGPVVLLATAADVSGVETRATRTVTVNNISGGTISGVVVKGRVEGATVRVYRYTGGVRGAQLGMGLTDADGAFANVALADGYAGPLLVEAGFGGTYAEEAGPATVTLDVADALRTIVPSYADGGAPTSVVVSPLTSFAVRYRAQLAAAGQGGATVAEQWLAAAAAMEAHFGVANIRAIVPLRPESMMALTAGARYGLVLVGLSELARQASTLGGGDAGTFGVAASSLEVWRLWQQDLDDGCWNGRAGAAPDAPRLFYGGTQALGDDPTRHTLAAAIAGYVTSARNATPFARIADVLPLLDVLTTGGAAAAFGACAGGTLLPPTAALGFDQDAPIITVTPAEPMVGIAPVVRGAVVVTGLAQDLPLGDPIDLRPTLRISAPPALENQDDDGDATDADVRITIDTMAAVGGEGTLDLAFETVDDSSNRRVTTRRLVVDNVPPVVTIDGVLHGGAYPPPRVITYGATDTHAVTLTATVDGAPFISGAAVVAPGLHTFTIIARDLAGNTTAETRTFRIDGDDPVITVTGVTDQGFHQPPVTVGFTADDADLDTITGTLDAQPILPGHVVSAEGPHTLRVDAVDHAGNDAPQTRIFFTLDSIPPVISIAGVDHLGVHAPPRTITFDAFDINHQSVTATLDGAPFVSGAAVNAVGDHLLVVTARDKAGHQVQATRTFTIDNTPPLLSVTGVLHDGFHRPPVTINFAAMDPHLDTATATLDGAPIIDGSLVAAEGPHDLRVVARDRAGLETVVTRHFTLDGTPPTVTLAPDLLSGGFYPRQAAVTFAGVDVNLQSVTATLDGAPFNSGNAIAVDGEHTLRVTALDKAGNPTVVTRTFAIDGVAPVITIVGVADGGFYKPGVATITFSQVDANPGAITATLDGAPFASGSTVAGPDGPRVLIVSTTDLAGNPAELTYTFTIDGTPPTITLDPDLLDGGFYPRQAAVSFAGANVNLQSVTATLDGQPFNSGNAIAVDGEHTLRVTAVDRAGNPTVVMRTFTIDGVAPVITIVGVTNLGFYKPGIATITFSQVDANPGAITATLNGAPFLSGTAVDGSDGLRTLLVTTTDRAGNAAELTYTFTLDGTGPVATVTGIVDGGAYRSPRLIEYDATDLNTVVFSATLTNGAGQSRAFASGASAVMGDGGLCVLRVTAVDPAGNNTVLEVDFYIDDAKPVITIGDVVQGQHYQAVAPTFAAADLTLVGQATATLDGAPFLSGTNVLQEGFHTLVVTASDRAGNSETATVQFTVDHTPPVLTLGLAGLTDHDGFLWTIASPTVLTVTATDTNLLGVHAVVPFNPDVVAVPLGNGTWALTIPDGKVRTAAPGTAISIVATDRAGNVTPVTRTFRYDANAPVLTMVDLAMRDEATDGIVFATGPDATLGGLPSYNPTHAHGGPLVPLGGNLTCDASTSPVAKFGYLLDEAQPAYAQETGGPVAGGRNPIRWHFTITDDGIGLDLATVSYRVVHAVSGAVALDWQSAPAGTPVIDAGNNVIGRDITVPLYRTGTTAPSIPALAAGGRFRLELRGTDRVGRAVAISRCWNLRVMPAPLYVGDMRQAETGPTGASNAEKYGFAGANGLSLADTTPPLAPVGPQLLNDTAPGTGLVEFPVFNPTTEPVWIAFDLARPQGVTVSRTVIGDYWANYSVSLADIDCGPFPAMCAGVSYPNPPAPPIVSTTATSPSYTIRVFEQTAGGTTTELTPCASCVASSVPAVPGMTERVVVQLPARLPGNAPPRAFWVMAAVKTIPELQPDGLGPYFEHAVTRSGVALNLTGSFDASGSGCSQQSLVGGRYRCTQLTRYRRYRFLAKAGLTVPGNVRLEVRPSRDGLTLDQPAYLVMNGKDVRSELFTVVAWTQAEPAPLPSFPMWPN